MPHEKRVYPYNNEPLVQCRFGCGRIIFFVSTSKSHTMPVDFVTKEPHFAHCPPYLEARTRNKEHKA